MSGELAYLSVFACISLTSFATFVIKARINRLLFLNADLVSWFCQAVMR